MLDELKQCTLCETGYMRPTGRKLDLRRTDRAEWTIHLEHQCDNDSCKRKLVSQGTWESH